MIRNSGIDTKQNNIHNMMINSTSVLFVFSSIVLIIPSVNEWASICC